MARSVSAARGRMYMQQLLLLVAAVAFAYVFLHVAITQPAPSGLADCADPPTWRCFVSIDARGDLQLASDSELSWYVGGATARTVRREAAANRRAMEELRQRVAWRIGGWIAPLLVDRTPADALRRRVADGRYDAAVESFDEIVASLSTGSANESALELAEIAGDLDRLTLLRGSQQSLAERLSPPLPGIFFWTSPSLSMLEILAWALFGVLTDLVFRTAESLRQGEFHPPDRFVGYAKLTVGPILALALVIAMINGWLQPERVEVRVWTLPLAGFLFGYGSRGIAGAIDRGVDRILGVAGKPVSSGSRPEIVKRRELVEKLMNAHRPPDLKEMRRQLKDLANEVLETEVAARDES
jgi:hypothetical protein